MATAVASGGLRGGCGGPSEAPFVITSELPRVHCIGWVVVVVAKAGDYNNNGSDPNHTVSA